MRELLKEVGRDYNRLESGLVVSWWKERFSINKVSQMMIVEEKQKGFFDERVFALIRFVFQARFVTVNQLARFAAKHYPDQPLLNTELDKFFDSCLLNYCILNEKTELIGKDALSLRKHPLEERILTVDYGGIILLSLEGINTNSWNWADYAVGVPVIKKALCFTELLLAIEDSSVQLRYLELMPFYYVGKLRVETDYLLSLTGINKKTGEPANYNLFTCFVEDGFEDFSFKKQVTGLESLLHGTTHWQRYFPIENEKPTLLAIVESSASRKALMKTVHVIAKASSFRGLSVMIIGYDELLSKGLKDAQVYSFKVSVGEDETVKPTLVRRGETLFS